MKKLPKDVVSFGSGAAVGVISSALIKQYDVPIPFISDYIPQPWGNVSTFGQLVIGLGLFGTAQFTKLIKNSQIKNFVTTFGIVLAAAGAMNGVLPATLGMRRVARAPVRLAPTRAATMALRDLTPTSIPPARVLA